MPLVQQMSIATDSKVITVICFDRAARFLFGCSADEFFDFAKLHPYSGKSINILMLLSTARYRQYHFLSFICL